MPISYLMDRKTVNIAKSQCGFIDVIINPSYKTASIVLMLEGNIKNLEDNKP